MVIGTAVPESAVSPAPRRSLRERSRPLLGRNPGLYLLLLVQVALVLPPIVFLVWKSLTPGPGLSRSGPASFSAFRQLFHSTQALRSVTDTLSFAVGGSLLAVVLGTGMAWLVARTNSRGKMFSYAAAFTGLAVPGMLRIIGWMLLLNPENGLINQALGKVLHTHVGLSFESLTGMIVLEGMLWVPMGFLLMIAPVRALDAGLDEASRMAGASSVTTVRRVTAPLLLPGLLSVFLLAFIRVLQSLEVALFVGVPARVPIWTSDIYVHLTDTPFPDYSYACAYSLVILAFLAIVLWGYNRAVRRTSSFYTVGTGGYRARRETRLGAWRWVTGALMFAVLLFELLPVLYLLVTSFLTHVSGTLWGDQFPGWTLDNYTSQFHDSAILSAFLNSLIVAAVTATACVALAMGTAWTYVRGGSRLRRAPDAVAHIPLVVPGIVIGLAILVVYIRFPVPVYGTVWIIVLALTPALVPYAIRFIQPALLQLSPQLDEQARICGGGALRRAWTILVPLLAPALIGSWILVCLTSLRELSAVVLLSTQDTPVLASTMLNLWVNGDIPQLCAFGSVVTAMSMVIALVAYRVLGRAALRG